MPEVDSASASTPETAPSLDGAIIARRLADQSANPNLRFIDTIRLRENRAGAITADHIEILDQNTGEYHHSSVKLSYINRTKQTLTSPLVLHTPKEVSIHNKDTDELTALRNFLDVVINGSIPKEEGKYLLLRVDDDDHGRQISRIGSLVSDSTKPALMMELLETVGNDADLLRKMVELAMTNPDAVKIASAALKLANYSAAIKRLESMVAANPREANFQALLDANPWMFGSDYSETIDRRDLVEGQIMDFPLRRTADDCLEIIEIKRPFTTDLFVPDKSHDSLYPRQELSAAIAQVASYIDELDARRDAIWRRHEILVHKVRAKIIIGRDGDKKQAEALRRFNSHLNRIEVMTFDQLMRISHNVISHLQAVVDDKQPVADAEVPF